MANEQALAEVSESQPTHPQGTELSEHGPNGGEAALSPTPPSAGEPPKPEPHSLTFEALKPGMRLKGTVRSIVEFGAFVDIGVGRDGLAHVSTLKRAGLDKTLQVGDVIDVQIRRVDFENNRISLTVPGSGKGTKTPLEDLEIGAVVAGRVVRLVDFGAFVDIGAQADGLLHVSQLPHGYVSHPAEVLKPGDEVQVRIVEVDARRRRISLSMKDLEEAPAAPEPEPAKEESSPTGVFAAAWEKALQERRQRRRRSSS
ncbi:MAG: S1 RNA-binding domain-containing protein [Chloroflexi bacterium]|nr:S1 RNA-binding domain-containing protein [Chloroflexota bacterium]